MRSASASSATSHVLSGDVPQSDRQDFADFKPRYDGRRDVLGRPTTFDTAAAIASSARTHHNSAQAGLTGLLRASDLESTQCRFVAVGSMENLVLCRSRTKACCMEGSDIVAVQAREPGSALGLHASVLSPIRCPPAKTDQR